MGNKSMIAVIDYGAGNLRSVLNAITHLGYEVKVTSHPEEVLNAGAVILPGVGAAGEAISRLKRMGLADTILKLVEDNKPLLGICLGLQLLLTGTEEDGWNNCLGIISGTVKKLPGGLKIPHMGWNQVLQKTGHPLFEGIPDGTNFYFVHSYYADPDDKSVVAGVTEYGMPFCSAIAQGNLVATQFHPERSGEYGLRMYCNFFKMAGLGEGRRC
jgi:imidazole glycerol-phosphate synthase subunit HisH